MASPAIIEPRRLIKSIAIRPGTNRLKNPPENRRFTPVRIRKLPSTTRYIRIQSHARALAPHNLPFATLHRQRSRTAGVQVGLAGRDTTRTGPFIANWPHGDRDVEAVDQAHVVVMQRGLGRPESHLDDGGGGFSAEAGAAEEAGAVSGLAGAFAGVLVEAAALSGPDSARPVLGDFEDLLFAALEAKTATGRRLVAHCPEEPWPDRFFAVVH
ncbi:hypothetical protein TIFTF001_010678 [Ficus carica]|uniref:Uncharacterized protein n=1 Tax=Ficus carica TaxID=3494 RepID=A0AA88ACN9_FICCA|nr:hypothetical protein TIFTF001_010678 [Ficus carica]